MKNLLSLLAQSDFYCPEATGPVLKSQTEFLVVIYLYAKLGHMLFLYSQTIERGRCLGIVHLERGRCLGIVHLA
jgi:hypothetical protein